MEGPDFLHVLYCEDPITESFNQGKYDVCINSLCTSRSISFNLLLAIARHEYGSIFFHNILEKGIKAARPNSLTLNQWKKLLHTYVDMKDVHPGHYHAEYFGYLDVDEEEGEEPLYQRLYFQIYNRLDEHEKSIFNVFPVFFIAHKLGFQFKQGSTDEVIDFWWDFHSLGSNIPDEHIHTFFHDTDVDWKSDFYSCNEETIYIMYKRFYRNGKVALPMLNSRNVDPSVHKYPKILDCLSERNITNRFGGIPLEIFFMNIPSFAPRINKRSIFNKYMSDGSRVERVCVFKNYMSLSPAEEVIEIIDRIFRESLTFLDDQTTTPSILLEIATHYLLKLPNISELLRSSKYLDIFFDRNYSTFDQERGEFAVFTLMWCWFHCLQIKHIDYLPQIHGEQMKALGYELEEWDDDSDDYKCSYLHFHEDIIDKLQRIVQKRRSEKYLIRAWARLCYPDTLSGLEHILGYENSFFEVFQYRGRYRSPQPPLKVFESGTHLHSYHGKDPELDLVQTVFPHFKGDINSWWHRLIDLEFLQQFVDSFLSYYNNPGTHTDLSPEEYPELGIDNIPISVHWARAHIKQREKYPDEEFKRISCVNSPNLLDKIEEKIEKRYHDPVLVYPSETPGFKTIGERTLENPQYFKIGRVEYPFVSSNCGVLLSLDWDDTRFLRTIDELIPVLNSGKYDEAQIHLFAYCIRALIAWCPKDWYMGVRTLLGRITEQHVSEVLHSLYYESLSHFHNYPRLMTQRRSKWLIVDHIDELFKIRRF
ncbi:hypothetical protein PCE1_004874 [Barthelona sp. PCE]